MRNIVIVLILMTSLVYAEKRIEAFDKTAVDNFLKEEDISKSKENVCRLYIKSNVSETPIVIRIEEGKTEGTLFIKGVEKEKLNYFYKYFKDGKYPIPSKDIKSFFTKVKQSGFIEKKENEDNMPWFGYGRKYLVECSIDGKNNWLSGWEESKQDSLLGVPRLIQMLTIQTVPKGKYNVEEELKRDYQKLMEEIEEPICSKQINKEFTIFSVVPFSSESDKEKEYPKLPLEKRIEGHMLAYLIKYVLKENYYHLKYRDKSNEFLGAVVKSVLDIDNINRSDVDPLMQKIDEKLKNIKMTPPDFIWRDIGYEYIAVQNSKSKCNLFYDIRRCVHCDFEIIDKIWEEIRKNLEYLFNSGAGKRKTYKENPD